MKDQLTESQDPEALKARLAAAQHEIAALQEKLFQSQDENATWELAAAQGHPNPCNLGPLCPWCEIDRLGEALNESHKQEEALEGRLTEVRDGMKEALKDLSNANLHLEDRVFKLASPRIRRCVAACDEPFATEFEYERPD